LTAGANLKENLYGDKLGKKNIGVKEEYNEEGLGNRLEAPKLKIRKGSNIQPMLNSLYATNINTRNKRVKKDHFSRVLQSKLLIYLWSYFIFLC
jgi:hypothetical protein